MSPTRHNQLGRRERQIMEAVYLLGRATVSEVRAAIEAPPSYSAVRTMLRILEDKGHLRHEQDGPRYVYVPMVAREKARRSILKDVVRTLFNGSASQAMAALIEGSDAQLDDDELARMSALIRKARRQEKTP